jgi:hypothetical protein
MTTARLGASIATLPDGSIFVVGGLTCCPYHWFNSAETYDPLTEVWTPTSSKATLAQGRATLLPSGSMLVTGGDSGTQPTSKGVAAAEMFDSTTNTWTATASMSVARAAHTQTLLPNGDVLVAGGNSANWGFCNALISSETYDPSTGTWTSAGNMSTARFAHSANLLPDGTVLVAGGTDCSGNYFSAAELYTPPTSFIGGLTTISQVASTIPANGDLNPYGTAVIPFSIGRLIQGNVLVSNFNDAANLQGTGTTIVQISRRGRVTKFAQIDPTALPGPCPGGVGLTTALSIQPGGWVVVGSLPTTDGTAATAKAGCLLVLDSSGNVVETITHFGINGPWDMTSAVVGTNRVVLFVSNVLNGTVAGGGALVRQGTVVRLSLLLHGSGPPTLTAEQVVGSHFGERTDPAALVVGPTGLGLGADGTLYVADTVGNRIAAISNAVSRKSTDGTGTTVTSGGALNGPLGLAIAPNGDVLTVNGGDGNIVETTPSGIQVATATLDATGAGTLFGLALTPTAEGIYFVDDSTNTLEVFR